MPMTVEIFNQHRDNIMRVLGTEQVAEFEQIWEISLLTRLCISQTGETGRRTLLTICFLLVRIFDSPGNIPSSPLASIPEGYYPEDTCYNIAKAFLCILGYCEASRMDFLSYFNENGDGILINLNDIDVVENDGDNEVGEVFPNYITIHDLIERFYGDSFMYDAYVMRFGPLSDRDEVWVAIEDQEQTIPWLQEEPDFESEPTPQEEPETEPWDQEIVSEPEPWF